MERLTGICVPISLLGIYLIIQGVAQLESSFSTNRSNSVVSGPHSLSSTYGDGWKTLEIGALLQIPLSLVLVGVWVLDRHEKRAAEEALADGRIGPTGPIDPKRRLSTDPSSHWSDIFGIAATTPSRRSSMGTATKTARSILKALLDLDLVAVRSHDEAIDLLARAIDDADPGTLIDEIVRFLDRNDVIDEIFATDKELAEVIQRNLPSTGPASENAPITGEYWLQMSDGFAHETWSGPYSSPAAAESHGWTSYQGIHVALVRREPGKPQEFIRLIGNPNDGLDNE